MSNQKLSISDMQNAALARGGQCLSSVYTNNHTHLMWKCASGHIWNTTPQSIRQGKWCARCAGIVAPTLEEMNQYAQGKGGVCLSTEYKNNKTKMNWCCCDGHEWKMNWTSISHAGQWCPTCRSRRLNEHVCRQYFECIFNTGFPRSRPHWLTNVQKNKLELDGFSEQLKIAFEYQGVQHYKKVKFFDQTHSLNERLSNDEIKKKRCAENSIVLIIVPYTVPLGQMGQFIIDEANRLGLKIKNTHIPCYTKLNAFSTSKMKEMHSLAKKNNGSCLSGVYLGAMTKLKWQCKCGYIFENTPNHIKAGQWCRRCAGIETGTIEQMHTIAKLRNGECLSSIYLGSHTPLKWRCAAGHTWEVPSTNIKSGDWCSRCSQHLRHQRLLKSGVAPNLPSRFERHRLLMMEVLQYEQTGVINRNIFSI